MNSLLTALGRRLAIYLAAPKHQGSLVANVTPELLATALRPGDVLLVEGSTRISVAIKYLTQSTWSHATHMPECTRASAGRLAFRRRTCEASSNLRLTALASATT